MYEMQDIRLLNVKSQTYISNEFVKDQSKQRLRAGKKFEAILDRLQTIVGAVCTELKEKARVSSEGFVNGDSRTITAVMFQHQQKILSLVNMQEERAQRFRQMRFANREAGMLCDFIRLVDYMAVENLVALTLSTNSEFMEVLSTPAMASLFQTTIAYGPDGLVFVIDDKDISGIIEKMVYGMISRVEAVPRMLLSSKLRNIVQSGLTASNGPNVAQIIRGSSQFVRSCAAIAERVRHNFQQTVTIAQVFEQWREVS
jgi:dynein heavy chain